MKTRFACLALLFCLFWAAPAAAHRVYISAWVDNDRMCSESMFSTKSMARGSTVTVRDKAGTVLHEGKTDEQGMACFPLPAQPAELIFVLEAGQGHRAETSLLPEDFQDQLIAAEPAPVEEGIMISKGAEDKVVTAAATDMDREAVAAIVRTELQKQLGPIRQGLTALQAREPGMVEIFGGIGWILGLAGVAMMVVNRKRKD